MGRGSRDFLSELCSDSSLNFSRGITCQEKSNARIHALHDPGLSSSRCTTHSCQIPPSLLTHFPRNPDWQEVTTPWKPLGKKAQCKRKWFLSLLKVYAHLEDQAKIRCRCQPRTGLPYRAPAGAADHGGPFTPAA